MNKSYRKGFTLVELLAVIVILAIILVIAVPKIMSVITDSKKSSLETSAKMIASAAEKMKLQNKLLGKSDEEITCDGATKISDSDYKDCKVKFIGSIAKVTVTGKGKFEGLTICNGTKNSATATNTEDGCPKEQYSIVGKEWSEIVAAVQSDEYVFTVGEEHEVDLGTLGVHTLRISNTTPCSEVKIESKTACGFVLEFADIITTHVMNSNKTNVGGYPASELYTYVNNTIYNSLPSELKNAIIDTKVVSSHGSTSGEENFISTDKLYLLAKKEVTDVALYDTTASDTITRQLDYYKSKGVFNSSNYSWIIKKYNGKVNIWWLRSANKQYDNDFYYIEEYENMKVTFSPADDGGVSPAFRLAN